MGSEIEVEATAVVGLGEVVNIAMSIWFGLAA